MQEKFWAAAAVRANPLGKILFVDSVNGSNGNNGDSPRHPLASMTQAVALADAGDTILFKGSITEAVTVSLAGLKIIGVGTGPNQATWTGAADAVCLTLAAENCEVANIKFRPPAYSASRATCAITLSSASYAFIHHCRFQGKAGSQAAIYSAVANSDNVRIEDCEFIYMNTLTYGAGILGVEAGGLSYSGWQIRRCIFNSCVIGINICGRVCVVEDCVVMESGITAASAVGTVLALGIDLSGTSSGSNVVVGCQLGGTYSATLYKVGAAGDQWYGNYVVTTGVTAANPA
jgi:hypothetical protein